MTMHIRATEGTAIASAHRRGLWTAVFEMLALHRQRRQLGDLDDAMLADIGLSRSEAVSESRRMAWDVPENWRR